MSDQDKTDVQEILDWLYEGEEKFGLKPAGWLARHYEQGKIDENELIDSTFQLANLANNWIEQRDQQG